MFNDGGPAYPLHLNPDDEPFGHGFTGMSLRDYFAAKAMAASINTESSFAISVRAGTNETFGQIIARDAFDFADAMIAEREKRRAQQPST